MEYQIYSLLGHFFYLIIFLFGLCLGSFVNSWVWRHHENIRISRGRSICPSCRRKLKWYENVPVLGYVFLKGKCLTCKREIPKHFIFVELITPILLVFVTWYHLDIAAEFNSSLYHRDVFFIGILLVIFIYDYLYKIILSELVYLGIAIGIFFNFSLIYATPLQMLYGALAAGGFFYLQYVVSKGKWIGGGDVRLGVLMGVWLGWPNVLVAVMFAYITGALVGLSLLLSKKKKMNSEIAFGTFLSLGTFVALLNAREIISWYLALLR